jgi:hypothetical protein
LNSSADGFLPHLLARPARLRPSLAHPVTLTINGDDLGVMEQTVSLCETLIGLSSGAYREWIGSVPSSQRECGTLYSAQFTTANGSLTQTGIRRKRKASHMHTTYTSSMARETSEQASRWEPLALASGAVAAAIYLAGAALFIGFVVPHMPPIDAPAAQHAGFYAEQSQSLIYRLVAYSSEAQMAFLLLFFGGLFGVLRRAERGGDALAAAVFMAGSAIAVISPLANMFENHLLLGLAAAGSDPLTVRAFDGLVPLSFALSGFPQAVVLGGTAATLLSQRLIPRWIGWFGIALGVVGLIGTGTLVIADLFPIAALSTLLFRVWLLALSVALFRSTRSASRLTPQRLSA